MNDEKDKNLEEKMFSNEDLPDIKSKNNKIIFLIIVLCIGITVLIIAFILMITIDIKNNINDDDENELYFPIPKNEDLNFTEEEHRQFSRNVATQTIVLATNNGLPIVSKDQVVLFGKGTNDTICGPVEKGVYKKGTKNPITPVMVLEGFENKIKENKNKFIYIKNEIGYEIGLSGIDPNKSLTEDDIKLFANKIDGANRSIAIMTISRRPVESGDNHQDKSNSVTQLTDSEKETYNLLYKYFDHIVIVLNVGTVIELNGIEKDKKTSIIISFYPGIEAGNAIADVLLGDENPSGHLSDTWSKTINDYPSTSTFLESEKYVKYKEGLFVGYRYFEDDEDKISKVVFPFGHGLSYTEFTLDNNVIFDSDIFTITSIVTNAGKRPGKQVVQVYIKKPQNENFIKVGKELIAFTKTKELKPGESQTLNMKINLNDLASYDDTGVTGNRACYILEKGIYEIYIGDSVASIRNKNNLVYSYNHKELTIAKKLTNRLVPQDKDVFDSNKKPNFSNFTNYFNEKIRILGEKIDDNQVFNLDNNNDNNLYSEVPTKVLNEINFKSVLQKKYKMEQLVDSMTNEELIFLSYGKKSNIKGGKGLIGGFYNSGITGKYNIPFGDILDGPGGLSHSEISSESTSWPCATALASSFDTDLIQKVGEKIGKEARKVGCNFWFSPGLNIHRNPLYGEYFQSFSEDPILTGKMAASLTKGIQSKRVSIVLNNFAFNNKVENSNGEYTNTRLSSDSRMAERVAREIYLKGFEIAIKEGNPWSIITSNNRINNMKTAESYDLLTYILRNEWNYEGFVMSGWYSWSHHDREAHAGISVKMPNNNPDGSKTILDGLIKGTVTRAHLKRNIIYFLNALSKTFCIDSLFIEPENKVIIKDEPMKLKVVNYIYRKSNGISYDICNDEDGGYYPINTVTNSWISFYVNNDKEQFRRVRIRYSGALDGFGISFNRYEEILGEITNLDATENFEVWNTTNAVTVKFPKGTYELTLRFLGYDYSPSEYYSKGKINWIEIL